jgi:dTMP kinase
VNAGRLVAFEGLDGSGKTTQVERLAAALRAAGHPDVLVTREPTDGEWGRRIRAMAARGSPPPPEEELRWFVEDRREHARQVLRPALAQGRIVVTDRYTLSSVAYQGARGLDWRRILAEGEAEFPLPDAVFLLEIDPAEALVRARARSRALESAFETAEFLARVGAIYHAIERDYVERIDAHQDPDAVAAAVWRSVSRRLDQPA